MSTNAGYLDQIVTSQVARAPEPEDQYYWAARYIFVPFRDRPFTIEQQPLLGLPELKAGIILPITKFKQQIVDNDAVMRVPVDYDGHFKAVGPGIERFKLVDRPPSVVFDALIRIFNPYDGVDTAGDKDNGIREVKTLRGQEDFSLLLEIQRACLPEHYDKARLQLAQLAAVILNRPSVARPESPDDIIALRNEVEEARATNIYQQVAKELYASTDTSFTWARWQYHNLQAQLENRERSGKERLSPLDAAVCDWLEMPYPRYQSHLAGTPQPVTIVQQSAPVVASAPIPTLWCSSCGATTNLGPEGQKPKFCPSCKESFEKVETVAVSVTNENPTVTGAISSRGADAPSVAQKRK